MSLKKIGKQHIHRERSQLESRKQFGLLEKHKDYVKRAKNYHKKKDYLNRLLLKASLRNPDEFYHKMITLTKVFLY